MKLLRMSQPLLALAISLVLSGTAFLPARAGAPQSSVVITSPTSQSSGVDAEGQEIISPADLVAILADKKSTPPLILNVGPKLLFEQAHIPGAEYIGAGSTPQGLEALRTRVKPLPNTRFIVLYCGCCPWGRCPNVRPAYKELHALGFTKLKLLMLADNFGADWAYKGYPTVRAQ